MEEVIKETPNRTLEDLIKIVSNKLASVSIDFKALKPRVQDYILHIEQIVQRENEKIDSGLLLLKKAGISTSSIAKDLGLSRTTLYNEDINKYIDISIKEIQIKSPFLELDNLKKVNKELKMQHDLMVERDVDYEELQYQNQTLNNVIAMRNNEIESLRTRIATLSAELHHLKHITSPISSEIPKVVSLCKKDKMRIVTWNINGLRACLLNGFSDSFQSLNADIFCIQESKIDSPIPELELTNYYFNLNSANKAGYAGTATWSLEDPKSVRCGIDGSNDAEGRVQTLEYEKFYLLNVYAPFSKVDLSRLSEKIEWLSSLKDYLLNLQKSKPIICCGDFNVAYQSIDAAFSGDNSANCTQIEKTKFGEIALNFIDTFRFCNPNQQSFSWAMPNMRLQDCGLRLDYIFVSKTLEKNIINCDIMTDVHGSDHFPVVLDINI